MGDSRQQIRCDEECCIRADGGWNEWSSWGECVCEVTNGSGTGFQTSTRECANPYPSCGGETCSGFSSRTQSCVSEECCKRVDGGWSWGVWSDCICDHTTGTGTRTTTRTCNNPVPSCGGSKCLGSSVERHRCDEMCCLQLDGGWSNWGSWSRCDCDIDIGYGTRTKERTCSNPVPACGGIGCSGDLIVAETCLDYCCAKVDGSWSSWEEWGDCQCDSTGSGLRTKKRTCSNPAHSCGGEPCEENSTTTEPCDDSCCKRINGGWSWPVWSNCKCNHETGTGIKTATRTCTHPKPSCGGEDCLGEITLDEKCDDECCNKADGSWTAWGSWSKCACDSSTGTGQTMSKRECSNPTPSCGGENCSGYSSRVDSCDSECCKRVDGGWSWGVWSDCVCDHFTGTGTRTSTRSCDNPKPSCGGSKCIGTYVEKHSCDEMCCKMYDGAWSEWGGWSRCDCDIDIGYGTRTKERTCSNPVPACGGVGCSGDLTEVEACSDSCCAKVDGIWSSWGQWNECQCDSSMEKGFRTTKRTCSNPAHSCGGEPCQGNSTMTESCDGSCCRKVNGGWSWPVWSECKCDQSKGTGVKIATRTCTHPKPYCGGDDCIGEFTMDEKCDDQCCKVVDAGWSEWSAWSECKCDAISGNGEMINNRSCDNPVPSCGGKYCEGIDSTNVDCSEKCCKMVHGAWSTWGEWGECQCNNRTGDSFMSANRTCTSPASTCGGNNCTGDSTKEEWCDNLCCK